MLKCLAKSNSSHLRASGCCSGRRQTQPPPARPRATMPTDKTAEGSPSRWPKRTVNALQPQNRTKKQVYLCGNLAMSKLRCVSKGSFQVGVFFGFRARPSESARPPKGPRQRVHTTESTCHMARSCLPFQSPACVGVPLNTGAPPRDRGNKAIAR